MGGALTFTVDIFVRSVTVHCGIEGPIAQRALETSPMISLKGTRESYRSERIIIQYSSEDHIT